MKIANKIIISLSVFFALAVAAIGYFMGSYSVGVIQNKIYSYLQSSNRARAEHIRTFLRDQMKNSEALAAASVYRDFLNEKPTSSQYLVIKNKIYKRFERTMAIDQNLLELYILNKNGKIIASSDDEEEGQDRSTDLYFINAQKETYIKSPYFYDAYNKIVYAVSSPIFSDNGELLGVSALIYTPEPFYNIVKSENGLGNTEENFLINADKIFLTPSIFLGEDVILNKKVETENARACFNQEEIDYITQNSYSNFPYKRIFSGAKDYRGVSIIGTHAYIPETGWCLITKVDSSALSQDINNITIINSVVLGLSFIILVFLVYLTTSKLTKGISKLEKEMKGVEGGDLDIQINVEGHDEISVLADSFKKMLISVKEARSEVDSKVRNQTESIISKNKELERQRAAILNVLEDANTEKAKAETLAAIVKGSNEAIISENLDGVVTNWNHGAEKLYGYTAEEMIGKSIKSIIPLDKQKETDEILKKIAQGEPVDHFQTARIKKDGSLVQVSISFSPVKDFSDRIIGISVLAIDITKEMEIDRAKSEFVSLASHQLRTPLSTINWYTEMILAGDAGPIAPDQRKYLDEIYGANRRMVELVNSLLNVSRMELGTFMVEPEIFSISEAYKPAVEELQEKFKSKKVTFRVDIDEIEPMPLDRKLTHIIFQNLISNAVKYTKEGGLVELSIKKDDTEMPTGDKGKFILIKVRDDGMGIPLPAQAKIFTKLFRADNAKQSESEGTGLGLYLLKSIVDNLGGKIWFETAENKGTTFFVEIPIDGMKEKKGEVKLA